MVIPSRTPEGSPNECPICGHAVAIGPSEPLLDAPCPHCGHLLWFVRLPTGVRVFDQEGKEVALRIVAERLGISEDGLAFLKDLDADSLDLVELEMELLSEFGCS